MRKQIDTLRGQVFQNFNEIQTVSAALDELSIIAGVEVTALVAQARRVIVEVSSGRKRYRPLLRHTIKRLIDVLQDRAGAPRSEW